MTTAKCEAAEVYETKQLIDNRDNKKYWVTKLQDGNCWMSQNLDLDLTTSGLTTQYTDITSNWTSNSTYKPASTQKDSLISGMFGSTGDYNEVASYDPGEYVYATPDIQRNCGTVTSLSACDNYAWTSIADLTADTDPNFVTKMEGDAISGNKYDSHYHVGNYYSYTAATAGTASSAGNAPGSICPKNWKLPTSGTVNNTASDSFYSLLREYGVNSTLISTVTIPQFDIRLSPLFFVYGGFVINSSLSYAGSEGRYWSSTAVAAANAYILTFSTSVQPSNNNIRYYGVFVRCVAR